MNDIDSEVSANSGNVSDAQSSQVSGLQSQVSNQLSAIAGLQARNYDIGSIAEAEESLIYHQNEDLKRKFYTLALQQSKKILKTIP